MRASLGRIGWMVRKELLQVFRDPRMGRLVIIAPIVQLLVFGYAVSTDVRHTPTIVLDRDQSRDSRELVEAFTAGGYFDVVRTARRDADLADALRARQRGSRARRSRQAIARDLAVGNATVQLLFDGTNSNQATIAKGNAERIVQSVALAHLPAGRSPALEVRSRAWYNPDLASRNYNVPAVIGLLLSLVCQLLTALAVVREREIGTLEQLTGEPSAPVRAHSRQDHSVRAHRSGGSGADHRDGAPVVPGAAARQPAAAALGDAALRRLRARQRPVDLDDLEDPAGGFSLDLPDLHADGAAVGFHVSGGEHAEALPVADPGQPDAPLHGGRPRHLP